MPQPRLLNFTVGLAFVISGLLFKTFYRTFSYTKELKDLGFADGSPSLFFGVGFSLLLLINPRFKALYTIIVITLASIAFEVFQSFGDKTVDINDITYSIFGGVIAILISNKLEKNPTY